MIMKSSWDTFFLVGDWSASISGCHEIEMFGQHLCEPQLTAPTEKAGGLTTWWMAEGVSDWLKDWLTGWLTPAGWVERSSYRSCFSLHWLGSQFFSSLNEGEYFVLDWLQTVGLPNLMICQCNSEELVYRMRLPKFSIYQQMYWVFVLPWNRIKNRKLFLLFFPF